MFLLKLLLRNTYLGNEEDSRYQYKSPIVENWANHQLPLLQTLDDNPPHYQHDYQSGNTSDAQKYRLEEAKDHWNQYLFIKDYMNLEGEQLIGVDYFNLLLNAYTTYYHAIDSYMPENLFSDTDPLVVKYKGMLKDLTLQKLYSGLIKQSTIINTDYQHEILTDWNTDTTGSIGFNVFNITDASKTRLYDWLRDIVDNNSKSSFDRYTAYLLRVMKQFIKGENLFNYVNQETPIQTPGGGYSYRTSYKEFPDIDQYITDKKGTIILYNQYMRLIGVLNNKDDLYTLTEHNSLKDRYIEIRIKKNETINNGLIQTGNYIIQTESAEGTPERYLIIKTENTETTDDSDTIHITAVHTQQEIYKQNTGEIVWNQNQATVSLADSFNHIAEFIPPHSQTLPTPPTNDTTGWYYTLKKYIDWIAENRGWEYQYRLINPFNGDRREQLVFNKRNGKRIPYIFTTRDIRNMKIIENIEDKRTKDRRNTSSRNQTIWLETGINRGDRFPKASKDDSPETSQVWKRGTSWYGGSRYGVNTYGIGDVTSFKPLGRPKMQGLPDYNYAYNTTVVQRQDPEYVTGQEDIYKRDNESNEDYNYRVGSFQANSLKAGQDYLLDKINNADDILQIELSLDGYYTDYDNLSVNVFDSIIMEYLPGRYIIARVTETVKSYDDISNCSIRIGTSPASMLADRDVRNQYMENIEVIDVSELIHYVDVGT